MVTYGGMSRHHPKIPIDLLVDRNLSLKSFWIYQWAQLASKEEKFAMYSDILKQVEESKLSYFFELHDFDDFDYALTRSQEPFMFRKVGT